MLTVNGMITDMETINRQQKNDIRLIGKFVETYCSGKHSGSTRKACSLPADLGHRLLCSDCTDFLQHAVMKRLNCPLEDEKPSCKRCRIHCYAAPHRENVREIMAYSGRKLIMRGRLDYLWHYLF